MAKIIVGLGNRRAYFGENFPYSQILEEMRYHPPNYQFMPKYASGKWDGYVRLLRKDAEINRYYCGTGLFLALRPIFEKKYELEFDVQDQRVYPSFEKTELGSTVAGKEIRDYQQAALNAMFDTSNTGGVILSATGTGKTFLGGLYFRKLTGCGCFIVDELQLLEQNREELEKTIGEPVGKIGESEFAIKRITCATIQTLDRHIKNPLFAKWAEMQDVLIFDELHLMLSRRNFNVAQEIYPKAIFGFTATLETGKAHVRLRAFDLCGPVIYSYALKKAVKEGNLSDGIVIAAPFNNEVPQRKWRNFYSQFELFAEHQREYKTQIAENTARNNHIEKLARAAIKAGRSVIIMVHRVNHVHDFDHRFHDIPHELMYGGRKAKQRVADTRRFDRGDFPLVIANQVFKKGIDTKRVNTIIDATAQGGTNDTKQKFGRGVRQLEGKDGLIYIDIADYQKNKTDEFGKEIRNKWASAFEKRLSAYRQLQVPVVKAPVNIPVENVIKRATALLKKRKKLL